MYVYLLKWRNITMPTEVKIQDLHCHVHNNYIEAVVGNEILKCQAPSNNAQK